MRALEVDCVHYQANYVLEVRLGRLLVLFSVLLGLAAWRQGDIYSTHTHTHTPPESPPRPISPLAGLLRGRLWRKTRAVLLLQDLERNLLLFSVHRLLPPRAGNVCGRPSRRDTRTQTDNDPTKNVHARCSRIISAVYQKAAKTRRSICRGPSGAEPFIQRCKKLEIKGRVRAQTPYVIGRYFYLQRRGIIKTPILLPRPFRGHCFLGEFRVYTIHSLWAYLAL